MGKLSEIRLLSHGFYKPHLFLLENVLLLLKLVVPRKQHTVSDGGQKCKLKLLRPQLKMCNRAPSNHLPFIMLWTP